MRKIFLLLIVFLSFLNCAQPEFMSEAIWPYVQQFREDTCIETGGISMAIADVIPEHMSVGYCFTGNPRMILFRQSAWIGEEDWEKEIYLAHELGHCALGISGHNDELDEEKNPVSIMHSRIKTLLTQEEWEEKKPYYYQQLINLAKAQHAILKDCTPITE